METNTTKGRRPRLRRGKAIVATLAALTAMIGVGQVMAPSSAMAMREQCYYLYSAAQSAFGHGNWERGEELMREWAHCEEHAKEEEEYPSP